MLQEWNIIVDFINVNVDELKLADLIAKKRTPRKMFKRNADCIQVVAIDDCASSAVVHDCKITWMNKLYFKRRKALYTLPEP